MLPRWRKGGAIKVVSVKNADFFFFLGLRFEVVVRLRWSGLSLAATAETDRILEVELKMRVSEYAW